MKDLEIAAYVARVTGYGGQYLSEIAGEGLKEVTRRMLAKYREEKGHGVGIAHQTCALVDRDDRKALLAAVRIVDTKVDDSIEDGLTDEYPHPCYVNVPMMAPDRVVGMDVMGARKKRPEHFKDGLPDDLDKCEPKIHYVVSQAEFLARCAFRRRDDLPDGFEPDEETPEAQAKRLRSSAKEARLRQFMKQ